MEGLANLEDLSGFNNYSFANGNVGVFFAYILLADASSDENLYDTGVAILEDCIEKLPQFDESNFLLFFNSVLYLEKYDLIDLPEDFFLLSDEYVKKKIRTTKINSDDLSSFLVLNYLGYRYDKLKDDYFIFQGATFLLCELIMYVDKFLNKKNDSISLPKHLKFLFYCELLIKVYREENIYSKICYSIEERLSNIFKMITEKEYNPSYCNFKSVYFDVTESIFETKNIRRNLSFRIQHAYIVEKFEDVCLLNLLENSSNFGLLDSKLGIILKNTLGKKVNNRLFIMLLYYSNYNYDLSFSPTSRVLFQMATRDSA
ncbi:MULTISPECIES: hypothetical protein [Sphingobacterium]|uniref:hypothetical protein n=1 Tax=Sphingobacterium TaxID=28453 RepID=UPI0008A1F95C|nr:MULTISPECIES: hypothetical protein [Sphingobacterium]OFV10466.1 hypothetical protein HMPREF3127_21340 [Sphingobacterium sp. HMSC13C05]